MSSNHLILWLKNKKQNSQHVTTRPELWRKWTRYKEPRLKSAGKRQGWNWTLKCQEESAKQRAEGRQMPQERGSRAWGPGEGSGEDTGFFLWRWGERWVKGKECEMGPGGGGKTSSTVPWLSPKSFIFIYLFFPMMLFKNSLWLLCGESKELQQLKRKHILPNRKSSRRLGWLFLQRRYASHQKLLNIISH